MEPENLEMYLLLEKILHVVVKFQMPKNHSGRYCTVQENLEDQIQIEIFRARVKSFVWRFSRFYCAVYSGKYLSMHLQGTVDLK
jgi:hypothetical protein